MNKFVATLSGKKIPIEINGSGKAKVNGRQIQFKFERINSRKSILTIENRVYEIFHSAANGEAVDLSIKGNNYLPVIRSEIKEKANEIIKQAEGSRGALRIKAPMPGLLLKLNKHAGDAVSENESVAVLEAMKMENDLKCTREGVVKEVKVMEGDSIEKGETIMIIE